MIDKEKLLVRHTLIKVDHRGKQLIAMEGYPAMLKLWALQNTTGKQSTYIADDTGRVQWVYRGRGKGALPEVLSAAQIEGEFGAELQITERTV